MSKIKESLRPLVFKNTQRAKSDLVCRFLCCNSGFKAASFITVFDDKDVFRQQGIWMFYFIQCTRDKPIRKVICFSQRLLLFLIIAEVSSSRLSVCSTPCCQVDNKDSYVDARTHRKNGGKTGTLYWNWFTLRDVFLVTFEQHNPRFTANSAAKAELRYILFWRLQTGIQTGNCLHFTLCVCCVSLRLICYVFVLFSFINP